MKIAIVGGGAAGFFAAIECARRNPAASVVIYESGNQFLRKVKISGGGRCNVTHACFDPAKLIAAYPRGGAQLREPFQHFQPRDTVKWFESGGVRLKTEADGRIFPVSDDSQTIVDCLVDAARRSGVELRTNAAVADVRRERTGFRLELKSPGQKSPPHDSARTSHTEKSKDSFFADCVLLAGGSHASGYRFAQALGHTIEPLAPSLFTFEIDDPKLNELSGISVDPVSLSLHVHENAKAAAQEQDVPATVFEQTGPLLITHWGLSGPAVLKLSAWAARELLAADYQAQLTVHWLPDSNFESILMELKKYKNRHSSRLLRSHTPVIFELPARLWQYSCAKAGVDADLKMASVSNAALQNLARELCACRLAINGKGAFKEEFVTCGGVRLSEVDFSTLQSRVSPGLYFAGEILDIDGITGGYNFQSAWTTGWFAGRAMAAS